VDADGFARRIDMKLLLLGAVIFLSGCAHTIAEPTVDQQKVPCFKGCFQSTNRTIKSDDKAHRACKSEKHRFKKSFKQTKKITPSANSMTDGFITFAYEPEKQPIIQTAPFQETVIRLEPGEKFTNISSGDPSRWSYAVAVSGKDEAAQQNILVKPSLPEISTNLVITTDQRLYNVRLVSTQTDQITRSVNFSYPEETMKAEPNAVSSNKVSVEAIEDTSVMPPLHFNYRITTTGLFSKTPSWQPVRVFDDGAHTTIQFPENITHRDLPVLFVIQNGQKTCVNYRFQSPYMMLDSVFDEATLVSGVGRSQQAVMIKHRND
jgi:type IV secretion system protein TrbG